MSKIIITRYYSLLTNKHKKSGTKQTIASSMLSFKFYNNLVLYIVTIMILPDEMRVGIPSSYHNIS